MLVNKVEDLYIYQIAINLSKGINDIVEEIPYSWNIKDVDQIKRSSASISANITEGFAQRFYPRKLIHYLNIALGSSDETKNHIRSLYIKGHITKNQRDYFTRQYKDLSIRILNTINLFKRKNNIIL